MKQHPYYQVFYGRGNTQSKIADAILYLLNFPKVVPEVFLRKGMGPRYFSIAWAVLIGVILYFIPVVLNIVYHTPTETGYNIFLIAYAIMAVKRYIEIKRGPSVFDGKKFSLDTGKPYKFFYRIRLFGKTPSLRTIDTWYEPLFFFLVGLLCWLLSQHVTGMVIMVCALAHFTSNHAIAIRGDHFIMDAIDKVIFDKEFSELFVQETEISPSGVHFIGNKPNSAELREWMANIWRKGDDDDGAGAPVF